MRDLRHWSACVFLLSLAMFSPACSPSADVAAQVHNATDRLIDAALVHYDSGKLAKLNDPHLVTLFKDGRYLSRQQLLEWNRRSAARSHGVVGLRYYITDLTVNGSEISDVVHLDIREKVLDIHNTMRLLHQTAIHGDVWIRDGSALRLIEDDVRYSHREPIDGLGPLELAKTR